MSFSTKYIFVFLFFLLGRKPKKKWHRFKFMCAILKPIGVFLNGAGHSLNSANSVNLRNLWSMKWIQFKELLCYLCPCGAVVTSLSLTQEVVGSNTAILLIFDFLSLNSADSVKTFRENSISSVGGHQTREFPLFPTWTDKAPANHTEEYFMKRGREIKQKKKKIK